MPLPTQGNQTRTKASDIRVAVFEDNVRLRNSRSAYCEYGKFPLWPTLQENRLQKAEPRVVGKISATKLTD